MVTIVLIFIKAQVLREESNNKNDYAFSNKVVGFNVDFGVRNQGIFKSVSLDQSQYKDTSESFRILTDMANQIKVQKHSNNQLHCITFIKIEVIIVRLLQWVI